MCSINAMFVIVVLMVVRNHAHGPHHADLTKHALSLWRPVPTMSALHTRKQNVPCFNFKSH